MQLLISDINKSYGKKQILKNINLIINDKPRLIALIAPNGSGKTTLLNIICNIEKADSGYIEMVDLPNTNVDVFEHVTFMQDNSVLYLDLTGMDHIKLVQELHQIKESKVTRILDSLKMTTYINKKVKNYSLGMKQHLLFALAILPDPKILLMDEPLNGLDPASVVRVRQYLIQLHKKGTTIIFSSHNLEQIDKLTNDIYFIIKSKLLSLEEIATTELIKSFEVITNDSNIFYQLLCNKITNIEIQSKHLCSVQCTSSEMNKWFNRYPNNILEYKEIPKSLEKIYFELYEDYNYDNLII